MRYGANPADGGTSFRVWAPLVQKIDLILLKQGGKKEEPALPLDRDSMGIFSRTVRAAGPGDRYFYLLDGEKKRADPVSRYLPEGVFGPSEIHDRGRFRWTDGAWMGIPLKDYINYELHVGTFTPEGTFDAAVEKLPHIKNLGATCVQVMPVFQFPGKRGWGYDGVNFFAVQNTYGGPDGLKNFVDACHRHGLAVCQDVVYNHFGPEGSFLRDFAPYFSPNYNTPWGQAINYDFRWSDFVREYVVENARYWIREYHMDALRLDASEWLMDNSPKHILREIKEAVDEEARKQGRSAAVIAESEQNNPMIIQSPDACGHGIEAQYSDDFHHSVHSYLTGEQYWYYRDFGALADVAKSIRDTHVYEGQYSPYRQKRHGASAKHFSGEHFLINIQNHDQVGNRPLGERLNKLISLPAYKCASLLLFAAPNLPLLFMGQEYGEENPFQYFVDFRDEKLIEAVRKGRKEVVNLKVDNLPDPQSERTFENSKLNWGLLERNKHAGIFNLYRDLIKLKRLGIGFGDPAGKKDLEVRFDEQEGWLTIEYPRTGRSAVGAAVFLKPGTAPLPWPFKQGKIFKEILHTENEKYGGALKGEGRLHQNRIIREPVCGLIGELLDSA